VQEKVLPDLAATKRRTVSGNNHSRGAPRSLLGAFRASFGIARHRD
jgi:hypothetical protein